MSTERIKVSESAIPSIEAETEFITLMSVERRRNSAPKGVTLPGDITRVLVLTRVEQVLMGRWTNETKLAMWNQLLFYRTRGEHTFC
jgi:hypothetical protein